MEKAAYGESPWEITRTELSIPDVLGEETPYCNPVKGHNSSFEHALKFYGRKISADRFMPEETASRHQLGTQTSVPESSAEGLRGWRFLDHSKENLGEGTTLVLERAGHFTCCAGSI